MTKTERENPFIKRLIEDVGISTHTKLTRFISGREKRKGV